MGTEMTMGSSIGHKPVKLHIPHLSPVSLLNGEGAQDGDPQEASKAEYVHPKMTYQPPRA